MTREDLQIVYLSSWFFSFLIWEQYPPKRRAKPSGHPAEPRPQFV